MIAVRRNLSIIPQDPFIFKGSLRSNIDPTEQKSDNQIWDVLKNVGLGNKFGAEPKGLNFEFEEKGANLSAGEKQLICLARATLRKNKILLIGKYTVMGSQIKLSSDEATANVDLKTDEFIQKKLNSKFHDATVITVAHRLRTIMHCDRILVLEKGRVAEFDSPRKLLQVKKSHSIIDKNDIFDLLI